MRTVLILAMFTASLAHAGWSDYEEQRDLSLESAGIATVEIVSRAGSLEVTGDANADEISVTALILVPGEKDEKAQKIIADNLTLTLEQSGNRAVLKGFFDTDNWGWGDSPSIRLEVVVPNNVSLEIDDSSGSIVVNDVSGDIEIDDSSGSIVMGDVGGNIDIDDGSGSIKVSGVGADITIEDGSGSITVSNVVGSVIIDDGSGSVNVRDVGQDLIITDDGSGGLNFSNIQGRVETDD